MIDPKEFSREDHHFVLPNDVVITFQASHMNMWEARDLANDMVIKLGLSGPELGYSWRASYNMFYFELWKS